MWEIPETPIIGVNFKILNGDMIRVGYHGIALLEKHHFCRKTFLISSVSYEKMDRKSNGFAVR